MKFDEQIYSRQTEAVGINIMNKFSEFKIFIYGLNGLGIEIAKNLILSGPKKKLCYMKKKITKEDLQCNFFITEIDICFPKYEICLKKLRELNNIDCDKLDDNNYMDYMIQYNLVIITEILEKERLEEINDICQQNKIGFIYRLALGLSFYCFVDYNEHEIINKNYIEPENYYILMIIYYLI
jgi:molybdopterin/thiamine biosynthesis adenylyltransferase